ncbi:MAG: hypothetical protein WC641_05045 [Patescibacteria group bacterium]
MAKGNLVSTVFLFAAACAATGIIACGDDSTDPPVGTAGTTATGGAAGKDSGAGGISGTGGASGKGGAGTAGQGGAPSGWKKGVVGTTKGPIELSKGSGQFQGQSNNTGVITVRSNPGVPGTGGDSGAAGAAGDAGQSGSAGDAGTGGTPGTGGSGAEAGSAGAAGDAGQAGSGGYNTAPTIDLGGITPDFEEIWFAIPPYTEYIDATIPPLTGVLKKDGTLTVLNHFPTWTPTDHELTVECFSPVPTNVNGQGLRYYGGLSMDTADCLGRHFLVSNAADKIWELFPDGTKKEIASGIEGGSAMFCHPTDGFLVVSTLPKYEKWAAQDSLPVVGAKLLKIEPVIEDGGEVWNVTTIAEMPITPDYLTTTNVAGCYIFPFTSYSLPLGLRIPITMRPDNTYLVADVGARKIYTVSTDGSQITLFADTALFTASVILAPNDVVYTVDAPIVELIDTTVGIVRGTVIKGFDGTAWKSVLEFTGYEPYVNNMSWAMQPYNCEVEYPGKWCFQPLGVYTKVTYGAQPTLYVMDPIKGSFSAVPLDMGSGGAGGDGGSGGTDVGGSGGTDVDGSAGAATGGSGGTDTGGSGGSGAEAGSAGSAGDSGSAGAGGT